MPVNPKFVFPKNPKGMIEPGNIINLFNRPVLYNPLTGKYSTTLSSSYNINGVETLLPTVINGKFVTDKEAIDNYLKTGQHLGKFNNIQDAEDYATQLHNVQEAYGGYYNTALKKFMDQKIGR